ncbi:MAG: DUF3575 domain-containing protein [Flavobacteriaceae bacterium]
MIRIKLFLLLSVCALFARGQYGNHISVDPFVAVFGTAQVQYERPINSDNTMSVGLSLGYKTSSGVFELPGISSDKITTDDFNFNGIKIIPEFRWYTQKQGFSGFYTGAYLKYQHYTGNIEGIYVDNDSEQSTIDLDAKIKTYAAGLEVGYKLMVGNRFFLDFLIAGPGLSFNTFELDENAPLPSAFYDDLSEALSEYGIFESIDTDFEIDANAKSETKALPAFRYGIKIGYSF